MDQASITPVKWSTGKKIVFRFFFFFFISYIFFNPNGVFPGIDYLFELYIQPFHQLIPWIGKNILHLSSPITIFTNGSGDTTYDYVTILFLTVMAVAGCLIWTLLDRKRENYNTLYYWLTVFIRYYAAFTMLAYGSYKIFKLQFPYPYLGRLLQPYGESSPMGLAWTFMGQSSGYNYFTGFAEVFAGVFLLFRRTTTLGAVLTFAVMGNVMAMNYAYDIPVKLLSTVVVIMAIFLMAKDCQRLINFFILNKSADKSDTSRPVFRKKWLRVGVLTFKVLLIAYAFTVTFWNAYQAEIQYVKAPKPPLYGIYYVESFIKNGDTLPKLKTDTTQWNRMVVDWPGSVAIKMINDSTEWYSFKPDTAKKNITMSQWADTSKKYTLAYSFPEKDILLMKGRWVDDSVSVRMKVYDLKKFLLTNRGFHWINERPLNR